MYTYSYIQVYNNAVKIHNIQYITRDNVAMNRLHVGMCAHTAINITIYPQYSSYDHVIIIIYRKLKYDHDHCRLKYYATANASICFFF